MPFCFEFQLTFQVMLSETSWVLDLKIGHDHCCYFYVEKDIFFTKYVVWSWFWVLMLQHLLWFKSHAIFLLEIMACNSTNILTETQVLNRITLLVFFYLLTHFPSRNFRWPGYSQTLISLQTTLYLPPLFLWALGLDFLYIWWLFFLPLPSTALYGGRRRW